MAKCVICFSEIAEGNQLCARCLENVTRNQGTMGQPQQGYMNPPQQGYAPQQQGYISPQQNYAPPQQGYVPPQQNYAPPQYNVGNSRNQLNLPNIFRKTIGIRSIVTGVLAFLPLKMGMFYGRESFYGVEKYTLSEFAETCSNWYSHSSGAEAFWAKIFTFIPILLVILGIFFIANGLLDIEADFLYSTLLKVGITTALLLVMLSFINFLLDSEAKGVKLGLSFWLVWVTIFSAYFCDVRRDEPEVPQFVFEPVVKSEKLADGRWLCKKCDTYNSGNICKGCGKSKY